MHWMQSVAPIEASEFIALAKREKCRACLSERADALTPTYLRYSARADQFIADNVFPTWRTNRERTEYIGAFEKPPTDAFPITYHDLALLPNLFAAISFETGQNYFATRNVISFHCATCGVRVVKDGNHRLLQCALQNADTEITVYEVTSADWRKCKVDMKNFCKCISNDAFQPPGLAFGSAGG